VGRCARHPVGQFGHQSEQLAAPGGSGRRPRAQQRAHRVDERFVRTESLDRAASPQRRDTALVDVAHELGRQARLAHAGLTGKQYEPAAPTPGVSHALELAGTTDERVPPRERGQRVGGRVVAKVDSRGVARRSRYRGGRRDELVTRRVVEFERAHQERDRRHPRRPAAAGFERSHARRADAGALGQSLLRERGPQPMAT
jgi:hypothetical protein